MSGKLFETVREFQTPMTGASMQKSFVHMKERGLDDESVGGPFKETPPPPSLKKYMFGYFLEHSNAACSFRIKVSIKVSAQPSLPWSNNSQLIVSKGYCWVRGRVSVQLLRYLHESLTSWGFAFVKENNMSNSLGQKSTLPLIVSVFKF